MEAAPDPASPSNRPRSRRIAIAGVAVAAGVAAILLSLVVFWPGILAGPGAPRSDHITAATLSFSPSNNPCFPSPYSNSTGLTVLAGGTATYFVAISNQAGGSARGCTIQSVNVTTAGFRLEASNVPLLVLPTGTTTLQITLGVPASPYTGPVNMSANATFTLPNIKVAHQNVTFANDSIASECGASAPYASGFQTFSGSNYNDSVGFFVISPMVYCSVTAVSVSTAEFQVISADTPVPLPINSICSVSFVLRVPVVAFSGDLSVVLTLTVT